MSEQAKTKIELFNISLLRLAFLSFITAGIYEIYWFYRNWKALRIFDSKIDSPAWRAIFAIFYCYSFFKTIFKAARSLGYKKSYNPVFLATAYIILLLAGNGLSRAHNLDKTTAISLSILFSLSFVPLLYVQKAIQHINSRQHRPKETTYTLGEGLLIIVGIIIFALAVFGIAFTPHNSISPENQAQVNELKAKVDTLTTQYDSCSKDLQQRQSTIDRTSQEAIDSYNADFNNCDSIRQQQNQTVEEYNKLVQQ